MVFQKGSPDVGDVHIAGILRAERKKRKRKKKAKKLMKPKPVLKAEGELPEEPEELAEPIEDPEQQQVDDDNLYERDGISHRTGGRWLHDTPVQKHAQHDQSSHGNWAEFPHMDSIKEAILAGEDTSEIQRRSQETLRRKFVGGEIPVFRSGTVRPDEIQSVSIYSSGAQAHQSGDREEGTFYIFPHHVLAFDEAVGGEVDIGEGEVLVWGRDLTKVREGFFQKHMGPGPHPSGSPQSVHGRSRDVRGPVHTFETPKVIQDAVDDWFELHPELTPLDIDWANHKQDHDFQMKVAKHYDSLPEFDEAARPSFEAFSDEIEAQFEFLTEFAGIEFQAVDYDPYRNLMEANQDLVENNRMLVLATDITGGHPMISNEVNDKFRFVHDIFGHIATGRNFDRHGEEAAFLHHASMFSDAARPAMASETRGQNASLIANREFGPQRAALMEPWAYDLKIKEIEKHGGPGPHKGTGTPQSVHAPGSASVRPGIDDNPTIRGLASLKHEEAVAHEPEITPLLQDIAANTEGELLGFEFRIKEESSLRRKIYRDALETGMTHEQAAANVRDHLRYTLAWAPEDGYAEKYETTVSLLSDIGWDIYDSKSKNFFAPGDHYGGINAQFTNGTDFFELQFHTPLSFEIKQRSHALLDELRQDPPQDRREELIVDMYDLWNSDLSYIPPDYQRVAIPASLIAKGNQLASEFMDGYVFYTFNDGVKDLALFRVSMDANVERWDGTAWVESTYSLPDLDDIDFDRVSDTYAAQFTKADFTAPINIVKSDEYQNLVFGWASVAFTPDGTQIYDRQGDSIDIEDLESSAYNFVVKSYGTGDMHKSENFGELVESLVMTPEKAEAMGIENDMPQAWWIGFRVPPEYHQEVREGRRSMFSIEGTAKRRPIAE